MYLRIGVMTATMKYHIQYLLSLLAHKWYVFIECCRLGIPWRGVVHDLSKFTPGEWGPRIQALRTDQLRGADGFADLSKVDDQLALCWLRHYRRNSHHWQHWIAHLDNGTTRILPMPEADCREMLADWLSVSRRADRLDIRPWYQQNKDNLLLHDDTRQWLEEQLDRVVSR